MSFNFAAGEAYAICSLASGRLMDIRGGNPTPGTAVQTYIANATPAQQWVFEDAGDGFWRLTSALYGGGTPLYFTSSEAGDLCTMEALDPQSLYQQWALVPTGSVGAKMICRAGTGLAVPVSNEPPQGAVGPQITRSDSCGELLEYWAVLAQGEGSAGLEGQQPPTAQQLAFRTTGLPGVALPGGGGNFLIGNLMEHIAHRVLVAGPPNMGHILEQLEHWRLIYADASQAMQDKATAAAGKAGIPDGTPDWPDVEDELGTEEFPHDPPD